MAFKVPTHALFFFLALLSTCHCRAPSPSLRQSAASPVPSSSPNAEPSREHSSNDNDILFPGGNATSRSSMPKPSLRPSLSASTAHFKTYLTLYISNVYSKMDATTTNIFENTTLTFMAENAPTPPGVAVDIKSVVVIGQLLVKLGEAKEENKEAPILQIDAFVSGSISMDFHSTNLIRVAVQNSIALIPYSYSASLKSYLHGASTFFESIDQITTSFNNVNGLVSGLAASTNENAVGIPKPIVVATAGTLTLFLILILGGAISFRRQRKRASRKKKSSSNITPDPNDPVKDVCSVRPPLQHIAPDDQASVTSSVSGISEIFCGASRYLKEKDTSSGVRAIKKQYPIQEKRGNESRQHCSTQEKGSDQASNASVLSELFFDNWSVFSAIHTAETRKAAATGPAANYKDDNLVGTFIVESLGQDDELPRCDTDPSIEVREMQEPSEASSWASIFWQNSFGYF